MYFCSLEMLMFDCDKYHCRYPNASKAIFCSLFGIFFGLILSIAVFTKFTPAYDVMHSLGTDMYIAPWTRVLPYLIGVGAGYIMFLLNGVMPLGEVCAINNVNYEHFSY